MSRQQSTTRSGVLCSSRNSRNRTLRLEQLEPRQLLAVVTLNADADTNIEESGPNDIEGGLGRMQVRSRDVVGSGRQHISYVRFDLSGYEEVTNASFSVTTSNGTNWPSGEVQVYGLNDVIGNTPQTWIESGAGGLSYNSSGAEVPGDGDTTTQDLGSIGSTGVENLWALGDLPANSGGSGQTVSFSSAELDNFLSSRVGNLATLLIVGADGTDNELLLATKETGGGTDGPKLSFDIEIGPLPARQMESLDRGMIAMRRSTSEVYVGWRMLGTDPTDVAFNLYRSTDGAAAVRLNSTPLTQTTDYVDTTANLSLSNEYFVRPVVLGVELAHSDTFILPANATVEQHLTVPLQRPAGGTVSLPAGSQNPGGLSYTYNANDSSVADLDGDGQYEIILKWDPSNSKDPSQEGFTGNTLVDAYRLDGSLLWRIDLGRNIRSGAHYSQIVAYDLDGDGRAEVVMKTADGTIDGEGTVIGDGAADWRDTFSGGGDRYGRILSGPEYFTVFDGLTGAALDTVNFVPARGAVSSWGDTHGNRQGRFQATVAYLNGVTPSIVWNRGYANPQSGRNARNEVAAFDYAGGDLSLRWHFEAATNGANADYVGQSAHSITVGDVDFDGKDEIITGASALDDDGSLLYNTNLGHGDALHLSDMDPSRPGLEVFMPHERPSEYGNAGGEFRDARTGELIFGIPATNDVGRGVAADIDPNSPGYEMWATTSGAGDRYIYSTSGQQLYETPGGMPYNFVVWWDADFSRELLDGTTISKWTSPGRTNLVSPGQGGINNSSGLSSNNGTKSTPTLAGDILGDWREEVIWRRSDNSALEIWSTTIEATNRFYTLMHDSQYRSAIAWQNSGYNQPPHPSFFLGTDMAGQPEANIFTVSANPNPDADFDQDGDVDRDDLSVWQQTYGTNQPQGLLPGDATSDGLVAGSGFPRVAAVGWGSGQRAAHRLK